MTEKGEHTQVKVAKITAFQAIVVALITVLGSGVGFYAGKTGPSNSPETVQRWLVVQGVDGPQGEPVRLVVSVNSVIYSYPADVPYTKIGLNMAEQKLPLPVDTNSYTISFEAQFQALSEGGFLQAKSRSRPSFTATNLPTDKQQYTLHGVIGGAKQAEVALTVFYAFK